MTLTEPFRPIASRALLAAIVLVAAGPARSEVCFDLCVIASGNSSIEVDPSDGNGLDIWQVDGGFQVDYARWFWFRWGSDGTGAPGAEKVLGDDASTRSGFQLVNAQSDDVANTVDLGYESVAGLKIDVRYTLAGGGAGSRASLLTTTVTITNEGPSPVDVRWFHFAGMDLDVGGGDGVDTAERRPDGSIVQTDDVSGGALVFASDRPPDAWAIAPSYWLSDELEDQSQTALTDGTSPTTADGVEMAFEYHVYGLPGGGAQWSYTATSQIVPEPSTGACGAAVLSTLALLRRLASRRRRR